MKKFINTTVFTLTYILYWPFSRLFYSVKINIDQSLKDSFKGSVIIASNHKNLLDAWHIIDNLSLPMFIKTVPIRVYATKKFDHRVAKKINRWGLIDLLHCLYGAAVIPENNSFEEKIKPLVQAIGQRESVLIFPEGKIVNGNEIGDFKRGIVEVHSQTNCPILPVSVRITNGKFYRKTLILNYGSLVSIPENILAIPLVDERYQQAEKYLKKIIVDLYDR